MPLWIIFILWKPLFITVFWNFMLWQAPESIYLHCPRESRHNSASESVCLADLRKICLNFKICIMCLSFTENLSGPGHHTEMKQPRTRPITVSWPGTVANDGNIFLILSRILQTFSIYNTISSYYYHKNDHSVIYRSISFI